MALITEIEVRPKIDLIKTLHEEFKDELSEVNRLILESLECDEPMILEIGSHLINSGGKRIRPLITILSSLLFNYEGNNHIKLAAATELIHCATLLHDDVVDNSLLRRFKATANSVWGNKSSILVGDFLFSQAFRYMVMAGSLNALEVLSESSSIIAKGEVTQLAYSLRDKFLSRDEYYKIIEAKTAVLFAASAKVGGIIARQNDKITENLYNLGKYIGLIFQIKDDILDYFSSSDVSGKNIGDDFFEAKITLPVIILREKADSKTREKINNIFIRKSPSSKEDLDEIILLMNNHNIEEEINSEITALKNQAIESLQNSEAKNNKISEYLNSIIDFASFRVN